MGMKELRETLIDETSIILGPDFTVEVTETSTVPHSNDGKITFPNLDAARQGCKLVHVCVLYIDMRRSTELSLKLKPQTVSKLYSAFVRAMTQCARHYQGHVRGIIGDRVMVLFDADTSCENAVNCAILMNSVAKYVLNKHFKSDEVTFGIGIDAGRTLVAKTGIRKNGADLHNYKSLVWLGRPANIASKLTDRANKPAEVTKLTRLNVIYDRGTLMTGSDFQGQWEWPHEFVRNLRDLGYPSYTLAHSNPAYRGFYVHDLPVETDAKTPPILMSKLVWDGFRAAKPDADSVKKGWFKAVDLKVPGLASSVFGGDVIFNMFKE
jgi:class 3 adenylate cyclase